MADESILSCSSCWIKLRNSPTHGSCSRVVPSRCGISASISAMLFVINMSESNSSSMRLHSPLVTSLALSNWLFLSDSFERHIVRSSDVLRLASFPSGFGSELCSATNFLSSSSSLSRMDCANTAGSSAFSSACSHCMRSCCSVSALPSCLASFTFLSTSGGRCMSAFVRASSSCGSCSAESLRLASSASVLTRVDASRSSS